MRDQYAGDISDLLKLAFLRKLAGNRRALGVGWYYNAAHDGRPDGRHREYAQEPKWRSLDDDAWNALRTFAEPSVVALQRLPIWPAKTCFHRIPVPATGNRHTWASDMREALKSANIVFLDPDNGLGYATERHATAAEVAAIRQPGRAVVLIKFPGRNGTHLQQLERYREALWQSAGATSVVTVCTRVWLKQPMWRWFTVIDGDEDLIARAKCFARALARIEGCRANVVSGSWTAQKPQDRGKVHATQESSPLRAGATVPAVASRNVCPECGHEFKGNGFDGIDAHWRARHESVMAYTDAWPLIRAGQYARTSS